MPSIRHLNKVSAVVAALLISGCSHGSSSGAGSGSGLSSLWPWNWGGRNVPAESSFVGGIGTAGGVDCTFVVDPASGLIKTFDGFPLIRSLSDCTPGTASPAVDFALNGGPPKMDVASFTPPPEIYNGPAQGVLVGQPVDNLSLLPQKIVHSNAREIFVNRVAQTQAPTPVATLDAQLAFDHDSARIRSGFQPQLNSLANRINLLPGQNFVVVGHTDSRGDLSYNQRLSEQRARAVVNYLVSRGVSAGRLQSRGVGETRPRASNDTEIGRAQNRRVELFAG